MTPPYRPHSGTRSPQVQGVLLSALAPLVGLACAVLRDEGLTANPIEYVTRQTGWWALAYLTLSLSVTPARRLTGWHRLANLRKSLGLVAFLYSSAHAGLWFVFDKALSVPAAMTDVIRWPYA